MAATKLNWVVMISLLICYIIAFGLAIAAEEHRSTAVITYVSINSTGGNTTWVFNYPNQTNSNVTYTGYYYCKYDSDVSSSYGVAAFVFLAIAQVIVVGMTKCFCLDGEHKAGNTRNCAVASFGLLWLCFAIAEICFLAGANKNALKSRTEAFVTGNQNIDQYLTCEMLSRGIFGAAAAFTFFAGLLGESYYICLVRSRSVGDSHWQGRDSPAGNNSASVGLNRPLPSPYALGSEDLSSARGNINPSSQTNDSFYGTSRPLGTANRPQTQMSRNPMPSPYALS